MIAMARKAKRKIHQWSGAFKAKFSCQRSMPYQAIGEAITKQIMTIHRYDRLCFRNKSITVAPNTFRIPISFRLYSLSNKTTPNTPTKDTNTAIKLKNKICLPSSSCFCYKFSRRLLIKWISRGLSGSSSRKERSMSSES